ncbi:hypothetical protein BKA67DRAFT_662125 [Truncatella angustata]|uniref:Thiaminase-2/PQQC domain-containing protein n=1 Tax=Truncatella angustata TaxID=152316 RepID=A0A9P8RQ62_9PEZI|nr:uncharacterized protein BKA67DRAFT_662125 [Truncatella angustata]KAH6647323.1 hypothetical protein BKA67DRAFT_662125 [Truncatella angustata]KAH8194490.1 hypothetical protein TruAng_011343 [Truncatella angustata]
MSLQPSLSSRLLSHPETTTQYIRATQSAFLRWAGQGRLSPLVLSQWLSQDRLYAQAYVRFIGGLLSRVRLPITQPSVGTVEWRVLSVLTEALEGITRELAFFEEMADKYHLDLACSVEDQIDATPRREFGPNTVTAEYVHLFDSFSGPNAGIDTSRSLFDGLVLLWATEKVYLDAWTYAKEQGRSQDIQQEGEEDLDGGALRNEFIPNWTSNEFVAFVREIQACLDDYAVAHDDSDHEDIALDIWKQVLRLEEGFWPNVSSKDVASAALK